jgi:hypothetical protein
MSGLAGVSVELLLFWEFRVAPEPLWSVPWPAHFCLRIGGNDDSSKRRWTSAALAGGGLLALGSVRVWFSGTLILPRLVDEPGN